MGLFKVIGGVVKGTATVVGGVAKGTAIVAEGVIKGTVAVAEGISDAMTEDENKKVTSVNDTFEVEEGITSIDSETFENYQGENTILLPSTLVEIDYDTFEECKQVEYINFSKVSKVKKIPSIFDGLENLKEVTIPEGVVEIDSEAFTDCNSLRKIVFPSTLKKLGSIEDCASLKEIDMSKVHNLKEIPGSFLTGKNRLTKFVIPEGVEVVGDSFLEGDNIQEVYIPSSVKEISSITEDENNNIDVYLYSESIEDIEDLCYDTKTLYVIPEAYKHYERLIEDIDTDVELRKMPSHKLNVYGTYTHQTTAISNKKLQNDEDEVIITENVCKPTSIERPQIVKSPGNLFSDGLEELINSIVESDEITDKKKEIVLRRAIKEGEDPDEVEMVLEARFFEAHNK